MYFLGIFFFGGIFPGIWGIRAFSTPPKIGIYFLNDPYSPIIQESSKALPTYHGHLVDLGRIQAPPPGAKSPEKSQIGPPENGEIREIPPQKGPAGPARPEK